MWARYDLRGTCPFKEAYSALGARAAFAWANATPAGGGLPPLAISYHSREREVPVLYYQLSHAVCMGCVGALRRKRTCPSEAAYSALARRLRGQMPPRRAAARPPLQSLTTSEDEVPVLHYPTQFVSHLETRLLCGMEEFAGMEVALQEAAITGELS